LFPLAQTKEGLKYQTILLLKNKRAILYGWLQLVAVFWFKKVLVAGYRAGYRKR
jgi:hypothetical protein